MKGIGKKAQSLLELKEKGMFNRKLLVILDLMDYDLFCNLLKQNQFHEGEDIVVRFSSESKSFHLPRSLIINSFTEAYKFIKENINEEMAAVIHPFVIPEFSGTLIKHNKKIYLNFVNGIWESLSSRICNTSLIEDSKATITFDTEEHEYFFVLKDKLITRKIKNTEEDITRLFKLIYKNIKKFNLEDNILYEFVITKDKEFVILEFRKENFSEHEIKESNSLFKVEKFEDLKKWNQKDDLILSIPVTREQDTKFLNAIELIKKHKTEVFVEYGLCSHPAILLREAGIKTAPYIKNKESIEIELQ